ncbi:MAG: Gx transporter family protein [Actinobacteria bacterium]|nr:Gx transporter family protein [Actinomycetota bacterium]
MLSLGSRPHTLVMAGALVAFALCLGLVESTVLPSAGVPGFRLGIANVAILLAFPLIGRTGAGIVTVGKILLVAMATGSVFGPGLYLAAVGGLAAYLSMAVMWSLNDRFSIVGCSVAGSAAHVLGQLGAVGLLIGNPVAFMFMPYLLGASLATGFITALIARSLLRHIPSQAMSVDLSQGRRMWSDATFDLGRRIG